MDTQPKPGEVIHIVPSKLEESIGIKATVIMLEHDYSKMQTLLRFYNPASGEKPHE